MEDVTVVADTGPLIALAKTDLLDLLEQLFSDLMIPDAVHHKLLAKPSYESHQIRRVLSTFLKTMRPATRAHPVAVATANLGLGEAEAIALANQHRVAVTKGGNKNIHMRRFQKGWSVALAVAMCGPSKYVL